MYSQDYPNDRLVRDLGRYTAPPFIPNLDLPPNYQQILPNVIVDTINTIIINNRKNNFRVYSFNRLSDNNFQNRDFVDLIQLTMSLIILNVEGYNMNLNDAVMDAIEKSCSYYASRMIMEMPELQRYITTRDEEQAVRDNLSELQGKLDMIDRIMSNGNRYSQPTQYQDNRFSNLNTNVYGNSPSRFGNVRTNFPTTGYQMPNVGREPKQTGRFDIRTIQNPNIREIKPNTTVVRNTQQDKGIEMKSKFLEGNDMNGNTFFGVNLDISSVLKKKEITLNNLTEVVGEDSVLSFLTGTTLEDILLTAKVKHTNILDKNSNIQTFRTYGILCDPIINKTSISKDIGPILGYTEKNKIGSDLITIAVNLKHILDNCKNNIDIDKNYLVDLIKTVSHINNYLTEIINEFLFESLNDVASIDSFMDDIVDLKNILSVKRKEVVQGWELFNNNIIASLTHQLDNSEYDTIIDNIYMDEEKKDTILLTKIVTVTSLDINYLQFGCIVDKDNSVIIDGNKTPNVFEVVDGIFKMKETECESLEDFIILNDGVHLKVYKDYINNLYKIKRVK